MSFTSIFQGWRHRLHAIAAVGASGARVSLAGAGSGRASIRACLLPSGHACFRGAPRTYWTSAVLLVCNTNTIPAETEMPTGGAPAVTTSGAPAGHRSGAACFRREEGACLAPVCGVCASVWQVCVPTADAYMSTVPRCRYFYSTQGVSVASLCAGGRAHECVAGVFGPVRHDCGGWGWLVPGVGVCAWCVVCGVSACARARELVFASTCSLLLVRT